MMKTTTLLALPAALLLPLAARAQDLCGQYDYYSSSGYYVNNNAWGSDAASGGSQCTHVDNISDNGVGWHAEWSWSGGETSVKSYPYSGRDLPSAKPLVKDIGSLPTKAEWAYAGDDIKGDVAYDLFTAADPDHDTSSGDYELMIWLAKKGDIYPIGDSQGTVTVDGQDWELWAGYNGDMKVFSFVAPSEIPTFESDVKAFYDHITDTQGFPADSQHLITFQFGTEPFTGSNARFDVWYWYAEVH